MVRVLALCLAAVPLLTATAGAETLKPATVQAFDSYMDAAQREMDDRALGKREFLWALENPARAAAARRGETVVESWSKPNPREVPSGLIHDWVGASFIPNAKAADVLAVLGNASRFAEIYKPEVTAARTVSRNGDTVRNYMRMVKKNVITVTLDAEFDVRNRPAGEHRWQSNSRSVRIVEVSGAGTPKEVSKPAGTGYGFLWRLNSYWQMEERDGGVYLECRAISLTRDIPLLVEWIVKPMVTALPKESLTATIAKTRQAVEASLRGAQR